MINKLFLRWIIIVGAMMVFSITGWSDGAPNDSCDGELISELNSISVTTSRTETGTVSNTDSNDYYYFKPATDGILTYSYSATASTDFYISTSGCGDNRVVNNGTSYSSHNITISATDTVYIRVKRESGTPSYSIPLTFTVAAQTPPVMGDIPNLTATVGTSFSLSVANYVTLTNGDPIINYTLTPNTLPAGLSFNSTTGMISGTPTTATSAVTFSVTASDNDGVSNSDSFSITVVNAPIATSGYRDFTLRKQLYAKGDMKTIG
ncbi:MAG: putative Ig domain-containing protein, partial [Sulfuricurvum sp.]|uniref:putative Ig domain-containing protein n=1 Tax=Sulfuricurvum sp. TaxID=2025608 RepID=UPI003569F8A9